MEGGQQGEAAALDRVLLLLCVPPLLRVTGQLLRGLGAWGPGWLGIKQSRILAPPFTKLTFTKLSNLIRPSVSS